MKRKSAAARPARGPWAFAKFADVYAVQADFEEAVQAEFNRMIDTRLCAREAPPVSEREAT